MFLRREVIVRELEVSQRIGAYIASVFGAELPSGKSIKKAIKSGVVRVNDEPVSTGYFIKQADRIQLWDLEENLPSPFPMDLNIIFEDEHFAVVFKPAGVAVSGNQFRTMVNALIDQLKPSMQPDALKWGRPVHRLDKATSGLLLIAKTITVLKALGKAFEEKKIIKTYHALVMGETPAQGEMNLAVDGRLAVTAFSKVEMVRSLRNGYITLLKLTPQTGRTHQIRIHCARSGFPILGDQLYANGTKSNKGLFLVATGLQLCHPVTGDEVSFEVPLPHKFSAQLKREQRRWSKFR